MNLNKIILLLLLIASALNVYAQECKAGIQIKTDLPSAKIYINTKLAGTGSTETELEKGFYHIVVMEETDRWNSQSFEDTLEITDCSDTVLNYHFNSKVFLNTDPQDVYVYHDSSLIGHTPLFLSVNSGRILLKKTGFEEKTLNVRDIRNTDKIKLNFIGEKRGENFFEQNIFKILVGGIIAVGGVSAYFKIKADDNFDQYQLNGNQYYLDQTHKYDLISGIAFGAVQVGFGFLIYYFLSD
jgi:hypothetical protein